MKFKEHPNQSTGSSTFLTIKDGQSIKGIFVGDIYEFYTKWVGGKSIVSNQDDVDAKIRFRCNFVTVDEKGELVTKIWEFPYAVYENLKNINDEYPLENTKVKITRTGTGTTTNYNIMPLLGAKDILKPSVVDIIKKMPLHELLNKKQVQAFAPSQNQNDSDENEMGF
jgi:hypothetical protein